VDFIETKLSGCFILEPKIHTDERGLFFETFRKEDLEAAVGYNVDFVQENQSISKKGVLRGLHFQKSEAAQAKLISVANGDVLDVIVDLRQESLTYGQHIKIELSSENKKSIFIPKGMAHGFLAISDEVVLTYKCDNYYNPKLESGIIYNDENLNIDWQFPKEQLILSPKDLRLPKFSKQ
jgi:dTDP-4-dehydrorhamnose 3,5-epimerase